MQPTAQAVGKNAENYPSPRGAKDSLETIWTIPFSISETFRFEAKTKRHPVFAGWRSNLTNLR